MPAKGNDLKATVRLEGGAAFKKEISDVNSSMKQLDAESKKVTASFDGQANSVDALTEKQRVLAQTLEQAERKVQLYSDRIRSLESQQKTIAESTEKYRTELKEAQEALSKMDEGTEAYAKQAKAVEDLSRKVALGEQNQERANKEIEKYRLEQTKAETEVEKLNREVDQNSKYLKEAENSADKCATSIDEFGRKTKEAVEESKGLGDVAKVALGNIAANAVNRLTDAAVDAAKAVVEVGSNFEAAMSQVKAISGASGASLDQMAAKAKQLGSTTKFSATEVAEGFKYMSLAGWDTNQMLEAIDGVVNLAAASEMDLGEASDMVTDYLSAFGLSAADAGKMVDEMVFAQSHSNTSTEQLGEAFGNCAANMNAAGQSMETTTAILEAMANQGTKGAQAGTALAAVMRDITSKMENGAIQIGNTSVKVQDSEGNFRDLVDILTDVEAATEGMGTAQKASALSSTFTARSIKAVNQVLNEGTGNIKSYKEALEDSEGAASKAASTMMDNFKGAVTEASSAAEGLGVAVFEKVSKPLTAVVDAAADAMSAVTEFLTPPEKSDLEKYLGNIKSDIEETKNTIEEVGQVDLVVNTNISEIEAYRAVLMKATTDEELSEFEKYQLNTAVEKLKGSIPELEAAYDAEKGTISLTTEEMEKLIDATERQTKQQAYSDAIEKVYKAAADAMVEAAEAQAAYTAATEDFQTALSSIPPEILEKYDFSNLSSEDITALYDVAEAYGVDMSALASLIDTMADAQKTSEEATKAWKDAEKAADSKRKAIDQLNKEEEEAADVNNVLAKNENGQTKAQEEQAEAMRAGIPIGEGYINMNANLGKVASETADATEKETEAVKESSEAWQLLGGYLNQAKEGTEDFAKKAAEWADERIDEKIAERAKASAEAEKAALESTRQAYEDNYNSIKETLSQKLSLWDAFDGGEDITVEQMLENLKSQTAGIEQYKQEMAEVIAAYGDELGPDLINTLQSMGADAANTWHHMWVTMGQDNAPELFAQMGQEWTKGLDLADQIAKYCSGNLTAYQLATGQMGSTKIEWTGLRESVQAMTPELDAAISAAQAAGVAIPDGLADGLASGETSATSAVMQITSAMKGTFDGLYEIAQQSGADIPAGLSEGIDGSAESYQAAINTLTESLSQAGNEAGTAAAEEISTGLEDNTSSVETAAGDTASAAATAAKDKKSEFTSAGNTAVAQYAQGFNSSKSQATNAGKQMAQAAANGAKSKESDFRSAGQNVAAAFAAGIRAGQSSAISAAVNMAVQAYERAKAAIGQHSPTGIFKDELGKNVPLAFAAGIKQYQRSAEQAAAQMAKASYTSAQYAAAVDGIEAQTEQQPSVNIDTSPIARMIGGMQTAAPHFTAYFTINESADADETGRAVAREIQQLMRMG